MTDWPGWGDHVDAIATVLPLPAAEPDAPLCAFELMSTEYR